MPMTLKADVTKACMADGTMKPVDLVHLSNMTMGDAELEREVLSVFSAQAGIYLSTWHAARDASTRKRAAHSLKGAARGIGAWQLAELAEAAEAPGFSDRVALERELSRVIDYIGSLAAKD